MTAVVAAGQRLLKRGRRGGFEPNDGAQSYAVHCSGLYVKVVRDVTGDLLQPSEWRYQDVPCTPAMLAATPSMVDVQVGWLRVQTTHPAP